MYGAVVVFLSLVTCTNAIIIVPEEIPTLLSVIYSNIPPIKLGFDTRFGFGFRLGHHADFQTIIELGPQTNTQPLGMENDTVSKRQSLSPGRAKLYSSKTNSKKEEGVEENETYIPSLLDVLLGRTSKKLDGIEFKKIPGIDDTKKTKKTTKSAKSQSDKLPTKIVILR